MTQNEPDDGRLDDGPMRELTVFLQRAALGDRQAQDRFFQLVYAQLHAAAKMLLWDGRRASLEPSALVNELMVKILDRDLLAAAKNRRYFFATAVDQMRKILIDHRRKKTSQKAGGVRHRVPLDEVLDLVITGLQSKTKCDLSDLEDALAKLAERNPRQAEIVSLRFYGGLTQEQIAELLEVSVSTIERDWRVARAKLYAQLRGDEL